MCNKVRLFSLARAHFLLELVVGATARPCAMAGLRVHAQALLIVVAERAHAGATCAHILPPGLEMVGAAPAAAFLTLGGAWSGG